MRPASRVSRTAVHATVSPPGGVQVGVSHLSADVPGGNIDAYTILARTIWYTYGANIRSEGIL